MARSIVYMYGVDNRALQSMTPELDGETCINCNTARTVTSDDGRRRFCLECAHVQELPQTGGTTRLVEYCANCHDELPPNAAFCITCSTKVQR